MRWVVGERRGKERRGGVKKREAIYFHQEGAAPVTVGREGQGEFPGLRGRGCKT